MSGIEVTGAMLRQLRLQARLGLRAVARRGLSRISDSHLSRVERGDRPVTPAVVAVYEKALGVRIDQALLAGVGSCDTADTRDPAVLVAVRKAYLTELATVAIGGPAGELATRLGQPAQGLVVAPQRTGAAEIVPLEHAAGQVRSLDLRFGGALAAPLAEHLLTFALALRTAAISDPWRARLHVTIGVLAMRAAWCNGDNGHHQRARDLFILAAEAAVQADEPDLRAHILAEAAAHHHQLGHPAEAMTILRLAEGDERIGPAVRCLLAGVRGRLHATRGDRRACLRAVEQVDTFAVQVDGHAVPAWMGAWEPAHVDALAGHALATLTTATGHDTDRAEAHKRLHAAVDGLAHTERTRATVLCQLQLAHMHHHHGDSDEATVWWQAATVSAAAVRSGRVLARLAGLQVGQERLKFHGDVVDP